MQPVIRWARRAAVLASTAAILMAAVLVYQALQVRTALVRTADGFEEAVGHLKDGDLPAARAAVRTATTEAAHADRLTSGSLWSVATYAPVVGDDASAVRTVAGISYRLSDEVLVKLVATREEIEPTWRRPNHGRLDLQALEQVGDLVVEIDGSLQELAVTATGIETATLVASVAQPVEQLQGELTRAAEMSSAASSAVRLLPPMLGGNGTRRYLVLFQNNAEVRATGGIPGAVAILTADDGRVRIAKQGTVRDLGFDETIPGKLTGEETALFGSKMLTYGADVGLTPDFPRSAELARARWLHLQGQRLDGVLATDPVALSYLLEATGSVDVPGGSQLTGSNAVDLLLNEVYLTQPDRAAQDAYFAGAARAVFRHVLSVPGNAEGILEALARSVTEGRLMVWSSVAAEQQVLGRSRVGGALPGAATGAPFVGVFLNDGTAAKMQYYLDHRVDVRPVSCGTDGRQVLEVRATLTSTAPADAARLPESVIGWRDKSDPGPPVRRGHMRLNVHTYGPVGGAVESLRVDGDPVPLSALEHLGHPVVSWTVELAPGETRELTYRLTTGAGQSGTPDLRVTPGARGSGVGSVEGVVCRVS